MSELTLSILGFPAVNNDLQVEIREPATNAVIRTGRPFLDGTLRLADLAPGAYEVAVSHPNLALPVLRRPIRILPFGDTRVSVVIDPSQFRNTPIADIPDANLGPVRDTVSSVAETVLPLSHKQAGEAIRAEDWNAMAGGHPGRGRHGGRAHPPRHPHRARPSGADDQVRRGHQQLQLPRQQPQRRDDRAATTDPGRAVPRPGGGLHHRPRDRSSCPSRASSSSTWSAPSRPTSPSHPLSYSRRAQSVGVQLAAQMGELVQANAELAGQPQVEAITVTTDLLRTQRVTSYSAEIESHRRTDRLLGAGGLSALRIRGQG